MIQIAVVDDNKIMLNQVCRLIKEAINEEITLELFENSVDFFERINKLVYDIVFLDIDMPKIDGFELAEALKCINPNIKIVFVSNLEHLVFQSFEFNPFRFVRKSQLEKDMISAVNDYQEELGNIRDKYFFKTNDAERYILVSDIVYFESVKHDIYIQTINDKYKLKRDRENEISIKTLTEKFEPKGFIRVHRSFLVNFKYIYMINRNSVILKNKYEININPHKVSEIRNIYQRFIMMEK